MPKQTQVMRAEPSLAFDAWSAGLHARLHDQLAGLPGLAQNDSPELRAILVQVDAAYRQIESERRGIANSMQIMADEAEALANEAREQGSEHLQVILDHIKDVVLVVDEAGIVLTFNPTGERVFGFRQSEVIGQPIAMLVPDVTLAALAAPTGDTRVDLSAREVVGIRKDKREFSAEIAVSRARTKGRDVFVVCMRDATERQEAARLAAVERDVFELLANNAPLPTVLEAITRIMVPNATLAACAIHLLGEDGQAFESMISTRFPPAFQEALERAVIGVRTGAAAAAVHTAHPVFVADAVDDSVWDHLREPLLASGFHATWALPIKGVSGKLLGALCVYRAASGEPGEGDAALMSLAAQLAGIAVERRLGEEAVRSSEAKFRGLFESVMEGVYQSGSDGTLISVNPAFVAMLGYSSADELYALRNSADLYWDPAERHAFLHMLGPDGRLRRAEFALRRRDGEQIHVMESTRAIRDAYGRVSGYEGVIADITERKLAEQAVFAEKERAQVTLQSIGDAVISSDAEGRIDYLNPVAETLTGWPLAEARGRPIAEVLSLINEATKEAVENPLARALGSGSGGGVEHPVLVTRAGQEIAIQESAAPICDRQQQVIGAVMVFHDVTKERRLKRALSYQASHDALTGLINRREFDNRVHIAVQTAQRGENVHVLLYIDLDQFKVVNDTCGHQAGDRLLRDITGLLQARVRASDTIARLGGDEFGLLLESCTLEQATRIAEGIRQSIRDYRFVWDANTLSVGASIGIVELKRDTESVASVLSAADIACYAAKDEGRNRIHIYDADGISDRHREMHWVSRVTRATEENRLELCYQPIMPLVPDNGRPFFELTVRLRDSDGRLVLPGEFIPAAERYNVMPAIDRWVIRQATELLRDWPASRGERPLLAVNLSGTSLNEQSFIEFVLQHAGVPEIAANLCFEITETAAVTNLSDASNFMRELKTRGCRFALDDFGSGLSSFMYLKTLPVDFLKIEGQFISRIAQDPVDRSMVEAVCKVGRALGICTIAESVENEEAMHELRRIGVDYVQGYHIARPAPLSELAT